MDWNVEILARIHICIPLLAVYIISVFWIFKGKVKIDKMSY